MVVVFGACVTVKAASAADPATSDMLFGYPASAAARELQLEQHVNQSPNAKTAWRDYSAIAAEVHRMGQPADHRVAVYMRDRLARAGWHARIVTYVVPIAWPVEQSLDVVAPRHHAIDLYEPAVPGDPWSANHQAIGKPYSGYSADVDATGPLVFANHGTAADYAQLKQMHVDVRGAIILVRMGGGLSNTRKAVLASRLGALAVLSYPEPFVDVFVPARKSPGYPKGPGRPLGAALRNTMLGLLDEAGDPTVDGVPLPGAHHKSFALVKVPRAAFSAITPLVGQQLLQGLDGQRAPAGWKTAVMSTIHIAGSERVHFVLKSHRFFGPIWDVIATLPGAVAPDESIVMGGHRDAWTYGAIDPGSGSVQILQVGDALGKLYRGGWRPYRSIIIGSWDGEELNSFGSDAWVRQHERELTHGCWAYVNTDEVTTGKTFEPYATDDLSGLVRSVARVALAPNGKTVDAYWRAQDKRQFVEAAGIGSDHEEFSYHEGIPSVGYIYSGNFGTWHSAYDDFASLKIYDPRMEYADAVARIGAITVMRLADATFPDVSMSDLGSALQRRLNTFGNMRDHEARRAVVVATLQRWVRLFRGVSDGVRYAATSASAANDEHALHDLERFALTQRAAFYAQRGIHGDRWHRSLLYNADDVVSLLPSLETTLDARYGDAALHQLVDAFNALPHMVYEMRDRHVAAR